MNERRWRRVLVSLLSVLMLAAGLPAYAGGAAPAQEPPEQPEGAASDTQITGETFEVAPAAVETVEQIMARERLLPRGALAFKLKEELYPGFNKQPNPLALPITSFVPPGGAAQIPALLERGDPRLPQTVGINFHAIQGPQTGAGAESPYVPPDSMGDVGPTQIVALANGRIKVFNKDGTLGPLNVTTDAFFASVRNGSVSDPHVRYDRLSQRWFIVIIDVGACPNNVLIAVSSGPTITGQSSFTFFAFQGQAGVFTDYPTLGVDANALYIGGNMFDVGSVGCPAPASNVQVTTWVVRKSSVLGAGPAVVTAFRNLVNYTTSVGTWTAQGVDNDDPGATTGYFIGVDFFVFSRLNLFRVTNPGGTPTLSPQIDVNVATTTFPQVQPQPGAGQPGLDALDDRLFAAAVHRDKIQNTLSLWTAHNIEVNASGAGSTAGNRNGSRWYQITSLDTTPVVSQTGTLFDPTATNPNGFWIPSIMMSGQGHAAIASSRASVNAAGGHASVYAAGRLRTDAVNTLRAASVVQQSTSTYDTFVVGTERWGDYSQTVVDPNDDQTMWTFQEYAIPGNLWGVRVSQLIAPPPATPSLAAPASAFVGQPSVNVTITGTPTPAGSEFFDPGTGFANRIAGTVTGGVTVNSTTFNGITSATLNVSTVGATPGLQTVRITNPDGQFREAAIFTVIGCPAITVNPTSVPAGTIGTAYSQQFTQTGGAPPVTFGFSGTLPPGLTFTGDTLSGTPTAIGSFNFTITATDTNGCTGFRDYTLVVGCQTITVGPPTLPNGTIGTAYNQTVTQTGGIGATTFGVSAGSLPTGLSLDPVTGVLSGTPSATGTFNFTITATDSNGCTGSQAYTVVIGCQTITVGPPTLADGTVGAAYNQTVTQTGGIGSTTFGVSSGTLPTGLSLDPVTGVISGTPTTPGSSTFTITATDSNGCTGSQSYTVTINCQTITVSPATLPDGNAGVPYSQTVSQTGGVGTTTFSVSAGTLPTGLALDPVTGVISGTPTTTGSFNFTITATDSNNCTGSQAYTVSIGCPTITVDPATLADGTVNTPYSQTVTQTGGVGTTTFAVTSGTLPTGLSLDTNSGAITGTPTEDGSFTFTITATDSNNCSGFRSYTVTIGCQTITVDPATLANGTVGTAYSQTVTQTGGFGTTTFAVTSGTLPTGLSLDGNTGEISGTPTVDGAFTFTVTATDSNGCTGFREYTVTIGCQTITVNPATLADGTVGTAYSQTVTQTGGSGTTTFAVTSGTLPTGLSLDSNTGAITGTPTVDGAFTFTITATDANGCTGFREYTVTIGCQTITVNPATLPGGTAGTPYSQTVSHTGGVAPVVFSVSAGTLPAGLGIDGSTGVISGTPTTPGSSTFTITATDTNGCTGFREYTVAIVCPTITVNPATLPNGTAGTAYSQTFTATGGVAPFTIGLTAGTLPNGLTLNTGTGELSGTPIQTGSFNFTITFTDANGCSGNRAYTLVIVRAAPFVATGLTVDPSGNLVFEAGETAVVVSPAWRNDTGAPETLAGTSSNFTGPGTSTYTMNKTTAEYGTVPIGGAATCTGGDCYAMTVSVPVTRPATHWDSTFTETLSSTDTRNWTLHIGDSFSDVPRASGFYRFIETLLHRGVTAGCVAPGQYCPTATTTRQEMAVFVLRAKEGATYIPSACTAPPFSDVPVTSIFCPWIKELAARGAVAGCAPGQYCPSGSVLRQEMAVFALRTLDPTFTPPACGTPVFSDVPANSIFCPWIEELVRRGVVTGCAPGQYCPATPVTRREMAVFMTLTFSLTLYGL